MTPKLLQKKSNRFLQLALPENLIANKRIGKREKYHHRPGAAANNLRGMEKRILGQWAFSWNMNKKRMEKQRTRISTARPEKPLGPAQPVARYHSQPLPFPRARLTTLPQGAAHHCFLVAPSLYILQDRISRALGGNVIQYLKKSLPVSAMPLLMLQAKAKENHLFRFPAEETRLEYSGTTHPSNRCAQQMGPSHAQHGASTLRYSGKRGAQHLHSTWADPQPPANLISDAPVHFGHQRGEMLVEHCRKNHFNMIYSLLAAQILQNKARGDRRDRIADHYRNQLAEWRKIAFLYGGLGLKTALRLHRQAHLLGGDVDSNFLSLLECRLDVTLKRAFFFSTLKAARQWIQRGKIYVNNQRCTLAGTLLQPADLITISPGATTEWKKSRLQTFSLMTEKAAQMVRTPSATLKWNRNQISHRGGLPLANNWVHSTGDRYQGAGWGAQHLIAFPASLHRRFPFSPALMRKWKEWSQIWSNSRYSFLERHNWRANPTSEQHFQVLRSAGPLNDRFTGKGSQRSAGGMISSTQSLYSSSALAHYLSATNSLWNNGQCAAKLATNPQINLKDNLAGLSPKGLRSNLGAALSEPQAALDFSLLQRRQTYITSFICGLPMSMPDPKARGLRPSPDNHNRLQQVGPGKLAGQGCAAPEKSGRPAPSQSTTRGAQHQVLRTPLRRCATRLGQVIGGERKNRCQWLHQRQSNVVDGLYALRWNKGFARKKSQGEKKNQWRWSCIKPLHLECSYKLGTVIFLFFPQKLAWPASINVSLLRKKLGG